MIEVLSINDGERMTALRERLRNRNVAVDSSLMRQVEAIIESVRREGDSALVSYAALFDGCQLEPTDLRVSESVLRESASRVDPEVLGALREAIRRVHFFHSFQRQESWEVKAANGVRLGQRITPIENVGVYVPGGSAAYTSSVVMNIVPAQIAGVDRIVVATPPGTIEKNPSVAAALVELNAMEVYAVGGAQAIAALAYGTETVARVDKIVGPGNRYVAAAKKLVFGVVGIDSIAGPSDVVVLADDTANASFIASDLLAQAEHGADASAILVTTSERLACAVAEELTELVRSLPRAEIVQASLTQYGAVIIVNEMEEACALVNELAPEHLEIIAQDEDSIGRKIRNAGAIFFGEQTPEAVGDYLAGPNHVLPTSGAARFSSALGVHDFVKRTSTLKFSTAALKSAAPMIAALARAEGLEAHARSALIRLESN